VQLSVILTVFAVIFISEIPDKTMIATLVMGSRSKPILVWLGASAAFLVHVTLAVIAGRLLLLLPHRVLEAIVAVLFLLGAAYLLLVNEKTEEEKGEEEAEGERGKQGWSVVATAFGVIFVGEFGDLTQILTVNFVAKYHQPVAVFIGAAAALISVAALGAFGGRALLKVMPVNVIRKIGGVVFLGFGLWSIYSLFR
jgi:Ca2+/H+ antiporter, TMEM165/GDT1 family